MFMQFVLAALVVAGSALLHPSAANALQDCEGANCAVIEIGDATVPLSPASASGAVLVSFTQAPTVAPPMQGPDDIAALAFSIGIPGDGAGNPLVVACDGGRLAAGAVVPTAAIGSDFNVVVENESCNARDRCLCPENDQQQRDDFVNVVIYGPRDLPEGGPVEIPRLPNSGGLFVLNLRAGEGAQEGQTYPLHVYCEQDEGNPAKPEFAAFLSMGDQSAIDQTADRGAADRSRIRCLSGQAEIVAGGGACVGDCGGNGAVAINELIIGVNMALGNTPVSNCPSFDVNGNGAVAINELIQAVNNALNGCP